MTTEMKKMLTRYRIDDLASGFSRSISATAPTTAFPPTMKDRRR